MADVSIDELNDRHGLQGAVTFQEGPGGLAVALLHHEMGEASVSLMGAHVLDWSPHGYKPVLWLSPESAFGRGREIRGGIPVCWPRFADQEQEGDVPFHGFVRTRTWSVADAGLTDQEEIMLRLETSDDEETRRMWPHGFHAQLTVLLGNRLRVELRFRNTGQRAWSCSDALHTYFHVGDIDRVKLLGLEGTGYLDKNDEFRQKTQQGPVTVEGPVDRIYTDTEAQCVIADAAFERKVHILKQGSRTTVVWNPWAEGARNMANMPDDAYRRMLCVETANAADDVVRLDPGREHNLATVLWVERADL